MLGKTLRTGLPALLGGIRDKATQRALQQIAERLQVWEGGRGNVLDRVLTLRDFAGDADILQALRGRPGPGGPGGPGGGGNIGDAIRNPGRTRPPAPHNVRATGGFTMVLVRWDFPNDYRFLSHFEVWRLNVDNRLDAVLIGTSPGGIRMYQDVVENPGTYYYWVRAVATGLPLLIGPFNAVEGTEAIVRLSPDFILDRIQGEILSSHLHESLSAPIGQIPGLQSALGSAQSAIDDAEDAIDQIRGQIADISGTPQFSADETHEAGDVRKYEGGLYRALVDMLTPPSPLPTDEDYWELIGNYASLGDAVAAHAIMISDQGFRLGEVEGDMTAAFNRLDAVELSVEDVEEGLESKASIAQLDQAKVDIFGAEVSQFSGLSAEFSSLEDDIATRATVAQLNSAISDEESARVLQYNELSAEFAAIVGRANLIVNPTFEGGIEPHEPLSGMSSARGEWSVVPTESAPAGTHVLQHDPAIQVLPAVMYFNQGLGEDQPVCSPGHIIRFSIHFRGVGATNQFSLIAQSIGDSVSRSAGASTLITPTSEWDKFELEWTVPEDAEEGALLRLSVHIYADGEVGTTQFAGAELQRLDERVFEAIATSAANVLSAAEAYADTESAAALTVQALEAQFGGNAASALDYVTTHVDESSATATGLNLLEAVVAHPVTGLGTKASLTQLDNAKADIFSAEASSFTHLNAELDDARAAIQVEQTVRASGVPAPDYNPASTYAVDSLVVGSDAGTYRAKIPVPAGEIYAPPNTTYWEPYSVTFARHMLKLDVDGHVMGIGLENTGDSSRMELLTNSLAIVSEEGGEPVVPFVAEGSNVYIDTAVIKMADITDALIGTLTAEHIVNMGTFEGMHLEATTIIGADISTPNGQFTVDPQGNVEMRSVEIRNAAGQVVLSSGTGVEWGHVGGEGRPDNYSVSGANLIYDPSFERHLAGDDGYWTPLSAGTGGLSGVHISTAYGEQAGSPGMALVSDAAGNTMNAYTTRDARWSAKPGDVFYVYARAFRTPGFNGSLVFSINGFNRNGTSITNNTGGDVFNQLVPNGWADVRARIVIPAGETVTGIARIYIGGATAGHVRIARVYVSRVPDKITPQNVTTFMQDAVIGTATIGDAAVETLKLAGQAVTIPVSAYTSGNYYGGGSYDSAYRAIQSAVITSTGAPLQVMGSVYLNVLFRGSQLGVRYRVRRGGTTVYETPYIPATVTPNIPQDTTDVSHHRIENLSFRDNPPAGVHTYTMEQQFTSLLSTTSGTLMTANRSLMLLETKR